MHMEESELLLLCSSSSLLLLQHSLLSKTFPLLLFLHLLFPSLPTEGRHKMSLLAQHTGLFFLYFKRGLTSRGESSSTSNPGNPGKGTIGVRGQARRCSGNTSRETGRNLGMRPTQMMAMHTCPNTRWWLSRPRPRGEEMTFSPPDMAASHNDSREWEAGPAGGREYRH